MSVAPTKHNPPRGWPLPPEYWVHDFDLVEYVMTEAQLLEDRIQGCLSRAKQLLAEIERNRKMMENKNEKLV